MKLEAISAARVRRAATKAGFTRAALTRQDGEGRLTTTWHSGPGKEPFVSRCPEELPPPQRQLIQATFVAWFEGRCPLCGVRERPISDQELQADGDLLLRVHLSPLTAGVTGIEHDAACVLRPVSMMGEVVTFNSTRGVPGAEAN
jgi:hypothetical protein